MIIDITNWTLELPSAIDDGRISEEKATDVIQNMIICYIEGTHLMCLSPESYNKLHDIGLLENLGQRDRSAIERAYNQYTQSLSLVRKASVHGTLSFEDKFVVTEISSEKAEFNIPHEYFAHISTCALTELITEDINDYRYYMNIARASVFGMGQVKFRLENIPGGGSRCGVIITSRLSDRRLTIAVVDSDRNFPGDKVGPTAKGAIQAAKKSDDRIKVMVLECRTMENTLSPSSYMKILQRKKGTKAIQETVANLERASGNDSQVWRHINLKYGITRRCIESLKKKQKSCPPKFQKILTKKTPSNCLNSIDGSIQCSSTSACLCVEAAGLGTSIIDHISQIMDKMSHQDLHEVISQEHELMQIGRMIAFFGCASPKIRS